MRAAFTLSGEAYSRHKASLKKLLAKHGLRWRGSLERVWWASAREKLTATYERDEARDVTTAATLVWEGTAKTRFLNELKAWVFESGGREAKAVEPAPRAPRGSPSPDLAFWEAISEPDFKRLEAAGMPKKWVERERAAWRKRREEKRQELAGQGP
jgi:hypothetical protein